MAKIGGLIVELKVGDSFVLGDGTRVTLLEKSGQRARLNVVAADKVKVDIRRVKPGAREASLGVSRN